MHWQNATITRIEKRVKNFFFRLPVPIAFRPGQHVLVRLTAADAIAPSAATRSLPRPDPTRLKSSNL
jgi:NAD(P)H-flavin reductase